MRIIIQSNVRWNKGHGTTELNILGFLSLKLQNLKKIHCWTIHQRLVIELTKLKK